MVYEDFTTYTETDSGGNLTVIANKVTITNMQRVANSHVTKDYGLNHFTDFEHIIEHELISGGLTAFYTVWLLSTTLAHATIQDILDNDDGLAVYCFKNDANPTFKTQIRDAFNDNLDFGSFSTATPYYLEIKRDGLVFTTKIYSDVARTVLEDTLSIICVNNTLQYLSVAGSRDAAGVDAVNGYVANLDIQETPASTGDKNIPNYFNAKYITHH